MIEISGRSADELYAEALWKMRTYGVPEESQRGPVIAIQEPVEIILYNPERRVLHNPLRNANPFFHLTEFVWMMAGRDDAELLVPFVKRYAEYAEPDGRVHGAYGNRWRKAFGCDQLAYIISELGHDPRSRRAVVQMWDANMDLGEDVRDRPCNTQIVFQVRDGALDMTVFNRSNDLIWGALGANLVHMTLLQELVANALDLDLGTYRVLTVNLHVYPQNIKNFDIVYADLGYNPRLPQDFVRVPVLAEDETYDQFVLACEWALDRQDSLLTPSIPYWLQAVFMPAFAAHVAFKAGNTEEAVALAHGIVDTEWREACVAWLHRHS